MNNYKFGNYICKLREDLSMTQAELAKRLNVSDKAISKWENGQAFPRIDTFEKLATELNTTVEDIFSASKDGISRVCFVNNFCSVMQIEVNKQIFCLQNDESKWVEIHTSPITVKITGNLIADDDFENNTDAIDFDGKPIPRYAKKSINHLLDFFLQADCVYKISEIEPDTIIEIDADFFDLGDKTLMDIDFQIVYPKINFKSGKAELISAKGKNSKDVIKKYRKAGLISDIGMGFIPMFLLYPIRNIYFKHLCKPSVLKKNIINAENHKEKSLLREKRKPGCFLSVLLIIAALICVFFIIPILFVDSEKPALLSSDYSTITYYGDTYIRIDDLPNDAEAETLLGATIWEDVRTDGLSNIDKFLQDSKVMLYKDDAGRKYLWLVENYVDTMLTDEEKDYDDFTEHYVYMFDPSNKQ